MRHPVSSILSANIEISHEVIFNDYEFSFDERPPSWVTLHESTTNNHLDISQFFNNQWVHRPDKAFLYQTALLNIDEPVWKKPTRYEYWDTNGYAIALEEWFTKVIENRIEYLSYHNAYKDRQILGAFATYIYREEDKFKPFYQLYLNDVSRVIIWFVMRPKVSIIIRKSALPK